MIHRSKIGAGLLLAVLAATGVGGTQSASADAIPTDSPTATLSSTPTETSSVSPSESAIVSAEWADGSSSFDTVTHIDFHAPVTSADIDELRTGIFPGAGVEQTVETSAGTTEETVFPPTPDGAQEPSNARSLVTTAAAAAEPVHLKCDHGYIDVNTTYNYSFQHKCGGTTGPWGIKNTTICPYVIGNIWEHGMDWSSARASKLGSSHSVECTYQLHGTYRPDHDGDVIKWADQVDFEVANGDGYTKMSGHFKTTGIKY